LEQHFFSQTEMALFSECTPQCAQESLTPPTLSETRFITNKLGSSRRSGIRQFLGK
jgi:hypothetical protein